MLRFLFPFHFRQWIGPLLMAGLAALVLAAVVVISGIVDLSAAKPHPDGWARFLHFTFDRSTRYHAKGVQVPPDLDSPVRIAAGAAYYGEVCAHCHGGPGLGQNPVALSMHPRPQYLVSDLPIAKFTDAELFRVVKAGVKYSAMPSWPADGRDDEVWQLVAFLRAMPKMNPETFRTLAVVQQGAAAGGADRAFGPTPPAVRYALRNEAEPPIQNFAYRTPAYGFAAYALGGDLVATCSHCHGANGAGGGAFPNLTLQDGDYLERTLTAFAQGRRRSGFMQVIASELSPQQIDALATYYAAMPRRATEQQAVAPPAVGRELALVGDNKRGLAPCAGCHGITRAAGKAYPRLEGQARWYLANQMRVFKAGGRGAIEGLNPMTKIARKLDDAQIEAVAAYYASQPPAAVQSFAAIGAK